LAAVHKEAVVTENVVKDVLHRNQLVEKELCEKTVTDVLEDASVSAFLDLKPAQKLEDFIHARRFNGKTFHKSKLAGTDGKLNKTWCKHQTAESIENDCSEEKSCLVWLAWKLRSAPIVLKEITVPALDASLSTPSFTIIYAGPERTILPSEYLMRTSWVGRIKLAVKGVNLLHVDENLMKKADQLAKLFCTRLEEHISERVDVRRQNHWTLRFTRDNIPAMAALMCLAGHVVDDLDTYDLTDCLVQLPMKDNFEVIEGYLGDLEGSYLFYNNTSINGFGVERHLEMVKIPIFLAGKINMRRMQRK